MAKSIYEPKKITRYVNNQEVIEGGLSSAPVPPLQRSPASALASPAVQAPVSTPVTTPTPAAPIGETRAFAFDGSTELTASFSTKGGGRVQQGTLGVTVSPTWSETTTGSFALFSILKSNTPGDTRYTYYIQRTSGSTGYHDYAGVEVASGSLFTRSRQELKVSPNFYSGSRENHHIQIYQSHGQIDQVKEGHSNLPNTHVVERTYSGSYGTRSTFAREVFSNTDSVYDVGGNLDNTFSDFTGSFDQKKFVGNMRNLTFAKFRKVIFSSPVPLDAYKFRDVDLSYKFEGNLSSEKGDRTLEVIGTETFVSSSL